MEAVFLAALGLADPAQRLAYLAEACGGDAALRVEVEELLRADEAQGFLSGPALAPVPAEQEGERIGRYKLLQEIGEGGFGTVWMAEQMEPVTRRVALKIIKLGMDTREVAARFEAERQALAMMDHPNIAKVLDAGATEKGRPFFVMELVKGMPITQYCDEAGLGTRERLALFGDVCSAINHAHQKGVIHRDIKPSNVMITLHGDKPVVKVIDFGIAKATQGKLTDKTLFTRFEQFIGTPVYMSPEQAAMSGLDIDTRSDIYALGILLYELLTGKPPFDAKSLASAGYEEMRRIIREVEPPKPSSRLSTASGEERTVIAKARHIEPAKVGRLVEPDLDWIVMKAIEKDRTRRYETANGLALDIQRFLADEPVSATPPSTGYQMRKFFRRHRPQVLAASLGLLLLLAGIAGTTVGLIQANSSATAERLAKEKAEIESAKSRQVSGFLQEMLSQVGTSVSLGRDTALLREILDKTVLRIAEGLTDQPEVAAELRQTIGKVYYDLGEFGKAEPVLRQALEARRKLKGDDDRETVQTLDDYGLVLWKQGRYEEAENIHREVLRQYERIFGKSHPNVATALDHLAYDLHFLKKPVEARERWESALAMRRKLLGNEHPDTAASVSHLGDGFSKVEDFPAAYACHEEALRIRRKVFGNTHPRVSSSLNKAGKALEGLGRIPEAEAHYREALDINRKLEGASGGYGTAWSLLLLGDCASKTARYDEAEVYFRESISIYRKLSNPRESASLVAVLESLEELLRKKNQTAEADVLAREISESKARK